MESVLKLYPNAFYERQYGGWFGAKPKIMILDNPESRNYLGHSYSGINNAWEDAAESIKARTLNGASQQSLHS